MGKKSFKVKFPKIKGKNIVTYVAVAFSLALCALSVYLSFYTSSLKKQSSGIQTEKQQAAEKLASVGLELQQLQERDEYQINIELEEEIKNIHDTYNKAVTTYEDLLKLKEKTDEIEGMDELFTKALVYLSDKNFASASATLDGLKKDIDAEETKIASSFVIPETVTQSNTPPSSGYSRQSVTTDAGTFLVSMVAADMATTRVIVDTASDGDCANECPVLPLATYVSRNNAYAGINGSYFCPATYPSCAGKTNSFDLLAMNHKKTYFNSSNNVYTNNPAVIFGDGYVRFVTTGTEWGRDTAPDGVLMNYPLLLMNGEIKFGGDDDPKKGSRGGRSFVAKKGSNVYIGVVHSATVAESARVIKALGFESAMNLDDGGSTALWSGGYKVGPGRNLPNVILFVAK